MINVCQYSRKPIGGAHSVERIFRDVRANLPSDIGVTECISTYPSSGLIKRIYNIVEAKFYQQDVNHITGEVHFITYLLRRRKTILTILDCIMMENLKGLKRWIFWFFWLWLAEKRCEVITVISESTRQQVLKYLKCDPEKVKVVYCNVSEEFRQSPHEFNYACPRILQVGTYPNKNLIRVAEALEGIECKFVIVGALTAEHKNALDMHEINYENLVNLSREELLLQYEVCDMLMFASTYEGFGLPIVEANAVGRPVMTGNVWSMPEVAGNAACIVNPFDAKDIKTGVIRIISDSNYRDQLVRNGFENVKRFKIDVIAKQYADLYRDIFQKNKKVSS